MPDLHRPFAAPPDMLEQLSTREGYDRWAEIYDTHDNPLVALEEPQARQLLGDVTGLAALDIGCGTGRHTAYLAANGATVTAVDFSDVMMSKARAKPECRDVRFIAHDLSKPLPLEPQAFDRVICGLVLDHIVDLKLLFGEMRRVCRPGGFAVVSVMHPAMSLAGVQARFTDPATGKKVQCGSVENRMCDYINAIAAAGWSIAHMSEHEVDAALATKMPKAARYAGWPMLVMFKLA